MNERLIFTDFYSRVHSLPIQTVYKMKGEVILFSSHIKGLEWEINRNDVKRIDDLLFPVEDMI